MPKATHRRRRSVRGPRGSGCEVRPQQLPSSCGCGSWCSWPELPSSQQELLPSWPEPLPSRPELACAAPAPTSRRQSCCLLGWRALTRRRLGLAVVLDLRRACALGLATLRAHERQARTPDTDLRGPLQRSERPLIRHLDLNRLAVTNETQQQRAAVRKRQLGLLDDGGTTTGRHMRSLSFLGLGAYGMKITPCSRKQQRWPRRWCPGLRTPRRRPKKLPWRCRRPAHPRRRTCRRARG